MFNLHPKISSFPTAILVTIILFEILSFFIKNKPFYFFNSLLVTLGFAFILATFFSGYPAMDNASQTFKVSEDLIKNHHLFGRITLILWFPLLVFSFLRYLSLTSARKVFNIIYFLLLVLITSLAIYTSYLGGNLVFKHGAGVQATLRANDL